MACKLIWSPAARDDLHDIVVFIARDNPERAMSFGYQLVSETDRLQAFPRLGRVVREYENENLRQIILRPYRIVSSQSRTKGLRNCPRLAFCSRKSAALIIRRRSHRAAVEVGEQLVE